MALMTNILNLIKRAYRIGTEEGAVTLFKRSWHSLKQSPLTNVVIRYYNHKYRLLYNEIAPSPSELIQIPPEDVIGSVHWKIKNYSIGTGIKLDTPLQRKGSFVIGGKWDQEIPSGFSHIPNKYAIYRSSLFQRYEEGYAWEETEMWKLLDSTQFNDSRYENVSQRCSELDRIFNSMKEDGYKKQKDLHGKNNSEYIDEVTVAISRKGDLLWLVNGFHRLHLAQILGLNEIPVRIGLRHKIWQELRHDIYNNILPEESESLRNHPDLRGL